MRSVEMIVEGSSPLTRGKPVEAELRVADRGLIPAHAGKTAGYRTRAGAWRAHPRSRGENDGEGTPLSQFTGSSPLTRGKLGTVETVTVSIGLIPAHAGKTHGRRRVRCPVWAHPRSRGENPLW